MEIEYAEIVIEAEIAFDPDIANDPQKDIELLEDKLNGDLPERVQDSLERCDNLPIKNVSIEQKE